MNVEFQIIQACSTCRVGTLAVVYHNTPLNDNADFRRDKINSCFFAACTTKHGNALQSENDIQQKTLFRLWLRTTFNSRRCSSLLKLRGDNKKKKKKNSNINQRRILDISKTTHHKQPRARIMIIRQLGSRAMTSMAANMVPIPRRGVDYRGKIVLAPMVRSSELPSRLMALHYGADLVWGMS